jgi:hypothetical protein
VSYANRRLLDVQDVIVARSCTRHKHIGSSLDEWSSMLCAPGTMGRVTVRFSCRMGWVFPPMLTDCNSARSGKVTACWPPRLERTVRARVASVARAPGRRSSEARSMVSVCPGRPSGRLTAISTVSPGHGPNQAQDAPEEDPRRTALPGASREGLTPGRTPTAHPCTPSGGAPPPGTVRLHASIFALRGGVQHGLPRAGSFRAARPDRRPGVRERACRPIATGAGVLDDVEQ